MQLVIVHIKWRLICASWLCSQGVLLRVLHKLASKFRPVRVEASAVEDLWSVLIQISREGERVCLEWLVNVAYKTSNCFIVLPGSDFVSLRFLYNDPMP